ncbi:diacylglycerol kinase [Christensenellaceae bacterium NSJ-44]|uniref:Diacylglycerol kinase n=1 Tax=Luoshenia tenuis TaxID=2763654 RepID=A0A926HN93_9FIRM|nr:diacylglycerol kinase [Luoshenia tenuis]MBC8529953.1 diacylglycerol kinase [Luoshenia tenuis]
MGGLKKQFRNFNYAIAGLVYCVRTQRSMRIHFILAIMAVIAGIVLRISRVQMVLLMLTIALVVFAEMINTAIEGVVDMVTKEYHPLAEMVKDVAAGAVLVTAVVAIGVGYLIFFERITNIALVGITTVRNLPVHVTYASLAVVVLVVIAVKSLGINRRGTFLSGGFPSGHSALAFSLFTAMTVVAGDPLVATLGLLLALLVAQSRIESHTHSPFEVIAGGVIGVLVTILLMQLATVALV